MNYTLGCCTSKIGFFPFPVSIFRIHCEDLDGNIHVHFEVLPKVINTLELAQFPVTALCERTLSALLSLATSEGGSRL